MANKQRKKEWKWPRPAWIDEAAREAKALQGGRPTRASMDRAMNLMMSTAKPKK
ncbi:hypothetical protein ABT352_33380 [Streptosporangium sp. NPDC000563]|uniref:hypothetical protein n=1 Tax=Streptosporangium sp. NPDC000563 TaxID=3154366 RepID=UPI003328A9A0